MCDNYANRVNQEWPRSTGHPKLRKYIRARFGLDESSGLLPPLALGATYAACICFTLPLTTVLPMVVAIALFLVWICDRDHARTAIFLDLTVTLVCVCATVSAWTAPYKPAAMTQVAVYVSATLIYCSIRCIDSQYFGLLYIVMEITACAYTSVCLYRFLSTYTVWVSLGFKDLVDYRAYVRLTPADVSPGNYNVLFPIFVAISALTFLHFKLRHPRLAYFALLPAALSTTAIVLSFSRSLYLSMIAAAAVLLVSMRRRSFYIGSTAILLIAVTAGLTVPSPIRQAMGATFRLNKTSSQSRSFRGRKEYLYYGFTLYKKNPWLGVGPGNFGYGLSRYHLHKDASSATQPFDVAVSVACELGCIGLSCVVGLAAGIAIMTRRLYRSRKRAQGAVLASIFIGLTCYAAMQSYFMANLASGVALYSIVAMLGNECVANAP